MRSTIIAGLLVATAANAAPLVELSLNSTKWTPEHILRPGEVILYGEGRMEVVHETVYHKLIAAEGHSFEVPEIDLTFNIQSVNHNHSDIHARQSCDATTAVITDSSSTFVDWDVQMSPVVIGSGTTGMDVSVASGYSIANSISVSAGITPTLIKDKLGASAGIDYSRTWTTQTVVTVKGTVDPGYSGVMITKPIKTRKTGRVLRGCVGSETEIGTFSADSFADGAYAGVKWVSGAIMMCSKKEFPLSRCTGSGNFV
ncbi:unnamed protein product [Penicillium glandicola]